MAFVTLGNVIDKITLLSHYYKSPVTFPSSIPKWAPVEPNRGPTGAQLGPNRGPHGMLLGLSIEPVEKKKDTLVETVYSTSCKHALRISKYSSITLAMGVLGRYPVQHGIILLTTMYWLRLNKKTAFKPSIPNYEK